MVNYGLKEKQSKNFPDIPKHSEESQANQETNSTMHQYKDNY